MGIPNVIGIGQSKKIAPGPSGGLILGAWPQFQQNPIGFLSDNTKRYGDIFSMRFGHVKVHVVNHPDYIEHVLSRSANHYDKNTRSAARISATCGDSLLSPNQDNWHRHRQIIQPVFQPQFFEDIAPLVDTAMAPVLERWEQCAKKNEPIDIVSEMMHLMIAISADILFSSRVSATQIERTLETILADTWRRIEAPFDASLISPRFHKRSFKDALSSIDNIVHSLIADRKQNQTTKDDVLARLLSAGQNDDTAQLSDTELRDATITLLLAGHETTASALSWAFINVAQSPDQEFASHNCADIFAETLRLYPSIWLIERRAIENTKIDGYHIARGSSVLISPYLLHRHTQFWDAPETFNPHRFAKHLEARRPRHAYLPFGLGKHRCVGLHMAKAVSIRVLENVHARFRLHLPSTSKARLDPGITLRHANPVPMALELI